jgi:VanZ family protein
MNKRQERFARFSLLAIILGITFLSLKSVSHHTSIRVNDKVGHFIAYALFSLNALVVWRQRATKFKIGLGLALVGYGLLMEFLQGFVPGREVSGYDLLANSIGVGIGYLLFSRLKRYL